MKIYVNEIGWAMRAMKDTLHVYRRDWPEDLKKGILLRDGAFYRVDSPKVYELSMEDLLGEDWDVCG